QSILIDENIFPDRAFRTYVSSHFDTDRDEQLSTEEINQATVIDFEWDDTISDLTGLNLFTNLEQLKCDNTEISYQYTHGYLNTKKVRKLVITHRY
ncbi:MAG: hypothetical protein RRY06_05925, partial [Lachnospiraceae bacterium]